MVRTQTMRARRIATNIAKLPDLVQKSTWARALYSVAIPQQ